MQPIRFFVVASLVVALLTVAGPVWAQANRTFVSGHGADSNPCSLSAPCRSFAQALTQTNAGGEITVLDPAGYGTVTITKSVSIVNDGVGEAGVTVTSAADAIDITVGASDVVNLRGLTLVGGEVGNNGILFNGLGALNIQNCVIRGFGSDLALLPSGTAMINVSDTIVSDTGDGVEITPTGMGTVTAVFNRVQASVGDTGFSIDGDTLTGAINVTIADSIASNNFSAGIGVASIGGANTQVMVVNSVSANNTSGIVEAGANATTYLARTTIAGNTTAFNPQGSALFSFGDNDIKGNGNDGGAIPLVTTK